MAKKKEESTGLIKIEEAIKFELPTINPEFTLGGVTISPDLITKEVNEILKIKLSSDNDKEGYAKLKDKAAQLRKTRTSTQKFRDEAAKPIRNWLTGFKKTVEDDIKEALAPGEAHCKTEMERYENWEAAEKRKEEEILEKRVAERSQQLSGVNAVKNFDSGHWTFPYAPHLIIEPTTLENEFGWDEEFAQIQEAFDQHQKEEAEKSEKSAQVVEALVSSRVMLLEMTGYVEDNGRYMKNGHVITADLIKDSSNEEWTELIKSHSTPPASTVQPSGSNPFTVGAQTSVASADPSGSVTPNNPFARFADITTTDDASADTTSASEVVSTPWVDHKFVESSLGKTILRVYPAEFESAALDIPNRDERAGFQGELGNGLCYIIYKK